MGIFDRPYTKIINEAPPQFSDFGKVALTLVDARVLEIRLKNSVQIQDLKVVVVGALALSAHRQLGTWSDKALREVMRRADFSASQLPEALIQEAEALINHASLFDTMLYSHNEPNL